MNRRYLAATLGSATLFASLFAAAAWQPPRPRLVWNASASVPVGLYRIDAAAPALGDVVAVAPPPAVAAWLARRGYLPAGTPLLKHVAALPGTLVCRSGSEIFVGGRRAATARTADRRGRELPRWTGCRTLRTGEIYLLNAAPDSLDGRYFGPLPAAGVIGRARPIVTRAAPGAPLRWRLGQASCSLRTTEKEHAPC
ncbi:MAG: S26 family signal peptidase [Sphingopyxis sp.]